MDETPTNDPGKHASREDAVEVVRRLREAGHLAYFAGGCVRDTLLGLTPKDYDVATDAPPDRVRALFRNTQAVGAAFGVILVRHGKSVIEVATFRTDLKYTDGRRPEGVVFTTAEEDAKRRDFSINGLFMDPLERDKVIDYVGGQEDLKNRLLRAIGEPNRRFEEDHLRLLRAVRFAARFGLTIDTATGEALRAHAEQLKRISPERIAEELRLMLGDPTRGAAWPMLWRFGLVDVIFRHLPTETKSPLAQERSILLALSPGEPMGLAEPLAAAILCYHWQRGADRDIRAFIGKAAAGEAVKAMRQALKISNDEADELREILESIAPLLDEQAPTIVTKKRFLAKRHHPAAMEVMEAMSAVGVLPQRIGSLLNELFALYDTDFAPPPLITGDDLTAAGLQPGPVFKRLLDAVYDAQLEERVRSKQDAMALALQLAQKQPG